MHRSLGEGHHFLSEVPFRYIRWLKWFWLSLSQLVLFPLLKTSGELRNIIILHDLNNFFSFRLPQPICLQSSLSQLVRPKRSIFVLKQHRFFNCFQQFILLIYHKLLSSSILRISRMLKKIFWHLIWILKMACDRSQRCPSSIFCRQNVFDLAQRRSSSASIDFGNFPVVMVCGRDAESCFVLEGLQQSLIHVLRLVPVCILVEYWEELVYRVFSLCDVFLQNLFELFIYLRQKVRFVLWGRVGHQRIKRVILHVLFGYFCRFHWRIRGYVRLVKSKQWRTQS